MQAIEMQRVTKTRTGAERTPRASSRATPSSLLYVPLRPKNRLFFDKESEERWNATQIQKKRRLHRNLHLLKLARAVSFSLIAFNNSVIVVLLLVCLAVDSGTVWEAFFQIPPWLSLILLAYYLLHRTEHRMFKVIKLRNYVAYTVLIILSFCTAMLFTLRIQHGVMCRDFAGVDSSSCRAPQFLVAISWITPPLGLAGNLANYYYAQLGRPPPQIPQPPHDPFRDCNIPRSPPPVAHKPFPPVLAGVRYGRRCALNDVRFNLRPLYAEFIKRTDEAAVGGRPFTIDDEYDLWHAFSPTIEPNRYLNYYEDMPPPRKVEAAELEAGWVDIPLYVDY